jgi:cell division protein ftsZ
MSNDTTPLQFNFPRDTRKIIKVVGVGGGGGNAVTHMFKEGIHDVSFVLCNTDSQALSRSDVPVKIALGRTVTEGLGAGNNPARAERAAEESEDDIRTMLDDGTKMVFITAGMGGGTGTGAAPEIARVAKEMGLLTVGIVTIPFLFEGPPKIIQALKGVEAISKNVDALLVVNNERLNEIYPDLTMLNAFKKADDTLTVAAKSIAEIITLDGVINLDFADVETTLKDGGVALISNGYGQGEGRLQQAIQDALRSPLLNNNDISNAKKILFNISFSSNTIGEEGNELRMDEVNYMTEFMKQFGDDIEVIWGTAIDESLKGKVKFTVLATGFDLNDIPEIRSKRDEQHLLKSEDEIIKEEEILRQKERERELMAKYYGRKTEDRRPARRPTYNLAILTVGELDDDAIITLLEENPAYNRDARLLARARSRSGGTLNTSTTRTDIPPVGKSSGRPRISFRMG